MKVNTDQLNWKTHMQSNRCTVHVLGCVHCVKYKIESVSIKIHVNFSGDVNTGRGVSGEICNGKNTFFFDNNIQCAGVDKHTKQKQKKDNERHSKLLHAER
jgi:hypothetical protein